MVRVESRREQVELAFLDAVFHLATGAVQLLVERLRRPGRGAEAGHDETRVGARRIATLGQLLGLADDPARAAPAVEGLVAEVLEPAHRLAGPFRLDLGQGEFARDLVDQARVAGQAEEVVDPMSLAPGHQRLAGEARVGAQDDLHFRPAGAGLRNDPFDLLDGAGAGVDVRPPELGGQQLIAAEDVKRQIAVTAIVAVKEAPFLAAVQRIVGRVQVEDDLLGRHGMSVEEQVDRRSIKPASWPILW
jgi:hypothetical protein